MALSAALRKSVGAAVNKYGRSDGKRIKPKEGRNTYRIVAPSPADAKWVPADGQFWADLGVHWIKADLKGKPLAVVGSRDVCYQEACPVGTAIDLAIGQTFDEDTKKIFEEMKVTKSVLFNAIDRTTNPENQEVEILELRPTAAQGFLDLMAQYDDAGQDITDIATGIDIVVTRSGKGMSTEYSVNVSPKPSKPVTKEALGKAHDLHDHIAKEFFRGDENKALNAITQISGIALPALASPTNRPQLTAAAGVSTASIAAATRTPTPALASTATAVEDAEVLEQIEEEAPAVVAATPLTPAALKKAALMAAMAEAEAEEKAEAEAAAKAAVAAQTAAAAKVAVVATPAPATSALSAADVDAVLSELDGI